MTPASPRRPTQEIADEVLGGSLPKPDCKNTLLFDYDTLRSRIAAALEAERQPPREAEGIDTAVEECRRRLAYAESAGFNEAYLQALKDMIVILEPMASRIRRGEYMHPTSAVMSHPAQPPREAVSYDESWLCSDLVHIVLGHYKINPGGTFEFRDVSNKIRDCLRARIRRHPAQPPVLPSREEALSWIEERVRTRRGITDITFGSEAWEEVQTGIRTYDWLRARMEGK